MLLKKRIREAILGSLQFFIVTHDVFSSVGAEMLAGGSVVAGWDPIEKGRSEGRPSGYMFVNFRFDYPL